MITKILKSTIFDKSELVDAACAALEMGYLDLGMDLYANGRLLRSPEKESSSSFSEIVFLLKSINLGDDSFSPCAIPTNSSDIDQFLIDILRLGIDSFNQFDALVSSYKLVTGKDIEKSIVDKTAESYKIMYPALTQYIKTNFV